MSGEFDEDRVARIADLLELLDISPAEYPTSFFLENETVPYYVQETEEIAFEEAFAGERRITRGQLSDFYRRRHESYCADVEGEMQQWSFFAFEFYRDTINERSDEDPAKKKIQAIDLYHWVE